MPTLNWIGKDKIINHHQEVPYKVLNHEYGFSENGKINTTIDSGNLIINGDNLEALKSLLPKYEGKVNCIYIDPPYNTGNESWVYNDNVNSAQMKKWLGKVVGKESEDLTRHDKWLCMMYPRLKLLHKLLAKDGAIFISIDDNEQANLKLMMDEVFGENNFVANFSWVRKKKGSFLSKKVRKMIEFVICYQKANTDLEFYGEDAYSDKWQPIVKRTNSSKTLLFQSNTIETKLPDGIVEKGFKGNEGTGINFLNDFEIKNGKILTELKCEGNFVWVQEFLNNEYINGTKISLSNKFGFNVLRHNQSEKTKTPSTLINFENQVGTNEDATIDLQAIFNSGVNETFNYSKPYSLVQYLINMIVVNKSNSIILDSFAGSGTTAHAVLNLNKQDGGNRKFILIEMENYAETITAERVKRVINGYADKEATGGSFDYYTLGEPLFDENNNLNETVGIEKIREYVWFTETRIPYTIQEVTSPFLGIYNDTSYYFIYEKENLTTLDYDSLAQYVQQKAERYIIYADNCLLPETFMRAKNIEFKKIPRDITRF